MSNAFYKVIDSSAANSQIHELAICAHNAAKNTYECGFSGKLANSPVGPYTPYFIASATKLFVTAIIIQLIEEKALTLNTPITSFFEPDYLKGLHVLKGIDYTDTITIQNLLSHTSGMADYFEQKQQNGSTFTQGILQGKDQSFDFNDVLEMVKTKLKPAFPPNQPGRAFYSDTNFQLLGAIIQNCTNMTFAKAVQSRIAGPLGLKNTWVFEISGPQANRNIIPLRNAGLQLNIPMALASTAADGAIVSTAADGLVFIKAFFEGNLFPKNYIHKITQNWKRIFFPLQYGTGIMLFRLPLIMTLFQRQPDLIGHSGISGAFLYAEPQNKIYISGTVNQLASRSLPYKIMLKTMASMR